MKPLRLTVWQVIAAGLLQQHLGLSLNEVSWDDADTVAEFMAGGIRPFAAINERVKKDHLIWICSPETPCSTPYLNAQDELAIMTGSTLAEILFGTTAL
jgi:cytoskeleton-binding toxin CbtA-like protein